MLTLQGILTHISHSISKDVVILTYQVEETFEFMEGQFMILQTLINDKIVKRAYSIYSTNRQLQETKTISFCIKRKEEGVFSTRATQVAKVGMKLTMTGPVGRFVDNKESRNYLFISVGSGLSPCYSLYQHLLHSNEYDKIANLFGERYLSHIPEEVLDAFSIQTQKVNNQIFLSREEEHTIDLHKGYVQEGIPKALEFLEYSLNNSITIFICGLPAMCDQVSQQLQDRGIPKNRLIIEKY